MQDDKHDETSVAPGAGDRRENVEVPLQGEQTTDVGVESVADPQAEADRAQAWAEQERQAHDATFDDVDTGAGDAKPVTDPRFNNREK